MLTRGHLFRPPNGFLGPPATPDPARAPSYLPPDPTKRKALVWLLDNPDEFLFIR